eukprot:124466-Alexandrium_andersonii.AAC.1
MCIRDRVSGSSLRVGVGMTGGRGLLGLAASVLASLGGGGTAPLAGARSRADPLIGGTRRRLRTAFSSLLPVVASGQCRLSL